MKQVSVIIYQNKYIKYYLLYFNDKSTTFVTDKSYYRAGIMH